VSFADGKNEPLLVEGVAVCPCAFCKDRGATCQEPHCGLHGPPWPCERCAEIEAAQESVSGKDVSRLQYCAPHGFPDPCPLCVEDAENIRKRVEQEEIREQQEKLEREQKIANAQIYAPPAGTPLYRTSPPEPKEIEPQRSKATATLVPWTTIDLDSPGCYELENARRKCSHGNPIFEFRAGEMRYCLDCLRADGTPEDDLDSARRFILIYAICNIEGRRQKRKQTVSAYLDKLPVDDFVSMAVIKVLVLLDSPAQSKKNRVITLAYLRRVAQNCVKDAVKDAAYRRETSVSGELVKDEDGNEMSDLEVLDSKTSDYSKDYRGIARERRWDDYVNNYIPGGEFVANEPKAYSKTRQYLTEAMGLLPKRQITFSLPIPGHYKQQTEAQNPERSKYPPMDVALMIKLNLGALDYDDETEGAADRAAYTSGISCKTIGANCDPQVSGRTVNRWIQEGYKQIREYFFQKLKPGAKA
jgi:hypothetical protein